MKIPSVGLICLLVWLILIPYSIAAQATFDLCGIDEISGENVTLSLNVSTENAMKTGGECSRVILLGSRRIKLTVEESNFTSGVVFEIQDGPRLNKGRKLWPKAGSQFPSSFLTSGNAMFIRFKDDSNGARGPSIFRGKISSLPYQDTCQCRGVKNGKLECSETETKRRCELKCSNSSYMNLVISNQDVTCDLVKGEWDINIHNVPLSCQKVQTPVRIKAIVNFNYANVTCQYVDLQKVASVFRELIANNSDIRNKGMCFSASGEDLIECKQTRLHANCTTNNDSVTTTVTIIDRITEPATLTEANSELQGLHTAYTNLNLKDIIYSGKLVISRENISFPVANESLFSEVSPWCEAHSDYIKVPDNQTSFVCSTCPVNYFYNTTTHTCQKCPSGSFASQRARSCTQKNDRVISTPIKSSCDNKCMKGKRVDSNSWMCGWCPLNMYQDSSSKINPNCTRCPDDKKTVFPGAQEEADCRIPCSSGKFLNTSSNACQDCPIGSFMDVENQVFMQCKMCEVEKTTQATGSKASSDCYKCTLGQFFNSSSQMCSSCPKGKYQDEINKDSCNDCPSGTTAPELGSKSLSDCVVVCGVGKYLNDTNQTCVDCPKNTYQNVTEHRSKTCTPCALNKITNATGQTDISQCFVNCSKGSFLDKSVSQCQKCPKGSFKDRPGQGQCQQCPSGKTTASDGESYESACIDIVNCTKGQYYDSKDMTCNPCTFGSYQESENHLSVNCEMCPSKRTSVKEGAEKPKQCITADSKNQIEVIKMSLRFTSLSWSDELKDKNSVKYQKAKTSIEVAIQFELRKDPSFEDVKVTEMRNGSIVADFELYFNDKVDYVPGEALQVAARRGKVGNISVSPASLRILRQDCTQPLGMETGKIRNDQITASNYFRNYEPYEGRLNANGGQGWQAEYTRMVEYLQIDFKRKVNITAVATQGQSTTDLYVKEYKLNTSDDGNIWNEYTEDGKTKVKRQSNTVIIL